MQRYAVLDEILGPLYGTPCWEVTLGISRTVRMEFGTPSLRITEPKATSPDRSPDVREFLASRRVHPVGAWHLRLSFCDWSLWLKGRPFATIRSSERRITMALARLNGETLVGLAVDARRGHTIFSFDLGGSLRTRPDDPSDDQWILFGPDRQILKVRGDGYYSYMPGTAPSPEDIWQPLR